MRRVFVDLGVILLRIVHMASGVAWAGGAALFFFYLEPAINRLGPDAEKFVDEVVTAASCRSTSRSHRR